ncbi:proline racemase family protein [Brevibacillus formosus]|uniref:Proline racemase n=1 Tax=Brevibacillus formosus TaxID=54913 RepID=A0A837KJH2_9BACL|nr:proline racemase family protein [Brevibacillus formosus]KLH97604.1 proline racemase [Brevibacillus formosus]MED1957606.1 proline racemase family protein [Brevibacillus formosus]PSJ98989.1 proline racemase [Brevibacillus formosus]GED57727.1 trans-3-hydroxy-L-proline dehydratase [Brevibacillus formosus]
MHINQLFTTIEAHTGGEPLRIITGGIPPLAGETILEKRRYFREELDHIRRVLMYEPRGHHGMYGCVMTEPVSPDAAFGVLFMHNEGYSTMCGHGIIAVVTAAIETGILRLKDPTGRIVIDSPAGRIIAHANVEESLVHSVSFENVPSFVLAQDVSIEWGGRTFSVDISFGGAFYAVVQAQDIGVQVEMEQLAELQEWGKLIKEQLEAKIEVVHPLEPELKGIYGVIISDKPRGEGSDLRNVTIFADKQIDRSPCGTGTAVRVATLHARGKLALGESFVHEGIVGSQFIGKVVATTQVGSYPAVIPSIEGKAFITGLHQFVVDPSDPLKDGFLLR